MKRRDDLGRAGPDAPVSGPDRDFLLAQYESLRAEQLQKISECSSVTRFALIAHGAIWTWLATNRGDLQSFDLGKWVPILLSLLFVGLYWTLRRDVKIIGAKIAQLESHFCIPNELAWERDVSKTYTRTLGIHWLLWPLLVGANIVIFAILGR